MVCTRSAKAALSVDPDKTVSAGTQIVLSAEGSVYDSLSWFQDGVAIADCKDQKLCVRAMTTSGEYTFKITVTVKSNGFNLDSEDLTTLKITVQ